MWFGFVYKLGVLLYIYLFIWIWLKNKFLRVYGKKIIKIMGFVWEMFYLK